MTNIGTKYILAQKFIFDPYSNTLSDLNDDNNIVRLGSNESRILLILIENSNQVVSRDQLHEYVWRDQGFQVDDSSLTQAISTLRKMLQDSTKSPQFVKTVPKRGYQLISSVDIATQSQAHEVADKVEALNLKDDSTTTHNKEEVKQTVQSSQSTTASAKVTSPKTDTTFPAWLYLVWALIVLLPLLAWVSEIPNSNELTKIEMESDIPLFVPTNQPQIDQWLPIIEKCTKAYQKRVPTPLSRVIATGGESEHIALNYIYPLNATEQNKTIVLFVNQTNFESLCQ
ncbi:winged helix-turn-helix domain-containing protein [Vibrio sp.]|uniref:winged helix-turn-helix domain-containing protein n=1 Tax=Vibrio sp. TaxID=678 RepID=UPI003AA8DA44